MFTTCLPNVSICLVDVEKKTTQTIKVIRCNQYIKSYQQLRWTSFSELTISGMSAMCLACPVSCSFHGKKGKILEKTRGPSGPKALT